MEQRIIIFNIISYYLPEGASLEEVSRCRKRKRVTEWSVLLTKHLAGDKIEKIEIGGACSTYGGRERCVQGSGGET
jgi:hypothetical protein